MSPYIICRGIRWFRKMSRRDKDLRRSWKNSKGWLMLSPLRRRPWEKALPPCRWGGIHHCWYHYSLGCPVWEHAGLQRPHTANKCRFLFSVSSLGQVATTDCWDGAEVGRHGNGDGRTGSAGNPRWHTPGAQSQSCRSVLCVCVKQSHNIPSACLHFFFLCLKSVVVVKIIQWTILTPLNPNWCVMLSSHVVVYQQTLAAERDPPPVRSCVSPAVLLSPPRQGHKWQQMPGKSPVQIWS